MGRLIEIEIAIIKKTDIEIEIDQKIEKNRQSTSTKIIDIDPPLGQSPPWTLSSQKWGGTGPLGPHGAGAHARVAVVTRSSATPPAFSVIVVKSEIRNA